MSIVYRIGKFALSRLDFLDVINNPFAFSSVGWRLCVKKVLFRTSRLVRSFLAVGVWFSEALETSTEV